MTPSDQVLLARDLARPGFMTLSALRHDGEVVDFVWDFASAVAARLPCHAGLDLRGRRLLHVLDGRHPEAFGCYLRVLLHGRPECGHPAPGYRCHPPSGCSAALGRPGGG